MLIKEKLPTIFIPHGGVPWHVMPDAFGDTYAYNLLRKYLLKLGEIYKQKMKSILVISAHWEEKMPTIYFGENHQLLYDYYGFPDFTYNLNWLASGSDKLSENIEKLLIENGFNPKREWNRGFDHGTFVPLMLAFPDAEIPVVQLSLLNSLDAAAHIKLGQALESLRSEGVLIIGSGMSFHNMSAFMSGNIIDAEKSNIFDETLTKIVSDLNIESRNDKLIHWKNIPGALDCHPRSEHLTPLFVIAGAAGNDIGRTDFSGKIMGFNVSAFAFG